MGIFKFSFFLLPLFCPLHCFPVSLHTQEKWLKVLWNKILGISAKDSLGIDTRTTGQNNTHLSHGLCMLTQLCQILCKSMDCSPPGSMGFSRQEYWSRLPFPPLGDLPDPRIEPASPVSPALAGRFFTTALPGKLQSPPLWPHFSFATSVKTLSPHKTTFWGPEG